MTRFHQVTRAMVVIEHGDQVMLAAVLADELSVEWAAVGVTEIGGYEREFMPADDGYIRLGGQLTRPIRVWASWEDFWRDQGMEPPKPLATGHDRLGSGEPLQLGSGE